jgi:hypothetical protein
MALLRPSNGVIRHFTMECEMFIRVVLLSLMIATAAQAQYQLSWQVEQGFYELGYLNYDYNGDGYPDLTKELGNSFSVYDGLNEYALLWELTTDADEFLTLYARYTDSAETEHLIFDSYNTIAELTFSLLSFESLAMSPDWITVQYPGQVSLIKVGDFDEDDFKEIVFGQNIYNEDEQDYQSRFYILDAESGSIEFESESFAGYMAGPYVGNMDGIGKDDILINIYNFTDETSELIAFTFPNLTVTDTGQLLPDEIDLGANYPNPFNASTSIPIFLERASEIEVNVVNTLGQRVTQLLSGRIAAGQHILRWDGMSEEHPVSSGLYFYEIITDGHRLQRPMVLLK